MLFQNAIKSSLSLKFLDDDVLDYFVFVSVHGDMRIGDFRSRLRQKPFPHVLVIAVKHIILLVCYLALILYLAHFEPKLPGFLFG